MTMYDQLMMDPKAGTSGFEEGLRDFRNGRQPYYQMGGSNAGMHDYYYAYNRATLLYLRLLKQLHRMPDERDLGFSWPHLGIPSVKQAKYAEYLLNKTSKPMFVNVNDISGFECSLLIHYLKYGVRVWDNTVR